MEIGVTIDVVCAVQTMATAYDVGVTLDTYSFMTYEPQGSISSRPGIRRKSSAGLLLSFKTPVAAISVGGGSAGVPHSPLPPTPPITSPLGPGPLSMSREWDSQSQYSESSSAATHSTNNNNPAPTFQGTSVEYLRDMVQKRIVTLTYMRSTHEG